MRLQLSGISKRFGPLRALTGVNLDLRGGEVHAILGENGAGKSTLMNVLYGLIQPDSGEIRLDDRLIRPRSPSQARELGIGMVHQHFTVVSALTTAENFALSLGHAGFRYRSAEAGAHAQRLAERFGLEIGNTQTISGTLSVGTRQRIEILKALAADARILILDEPTAVLTPNEVQQLFEVLKTLRQEGRLVIFITHKLPEVRAIADRVSVLRGGTVVGGGTPSDLSDDDLAELMVGRLAAAAIPGHRPRGDEVLRLEQMALARGDGGISFGLRAGEIVGIVGVDGNGQDELFEVLAGLRTPSSGRILVLGREIERYEPASMQTSGIGIIPPDRRADGLVAEMKVRDNLVLNRILMRRFSHCGVLQPEQLREFAERQSNVYQLRPGALDAPAGVLSGGNQQRIVVARALATEPEILVAVNPTRGLDIGAARAVQRALGEYAARGKSVVLISTDLEEAMEVSARLGVLYRRGLSPLMEPPYSLTHIGLLMAGAESN